MHRTGDHEEHDDHTQRTDIPLGLIAMGSGAGSSLEGSDMDRELDEVARRLDVEKPGSDRSADRDRDERHRDAAD